MPVFYLSEDIQFPPVHLSDENGILAMGGDLSKERLLEAYKNGIFPWYSAGEPILWWSPDPRFVLFPEEIRVSRTMRQTLNRKIYDITYDRCFSRVIAGCKKPRNKQKETWITKEMIHAYCALHEEGYAHSVEAWLEGKLAGGLYGISLGGCFFGESMFSETPNASKAAFVTLVTRLIKNGFPLVDCQVYTQHLESLGARHIPRHEFLAILGESLTHETIRGNWGTMPQFRD